VATADWKYFGFGEVCLVASMICLLGCPLVSPPVPLKEFTALSLLIDEYDTYYE